jgi:hypothetical protein
VDTPPPPISDDVLNGKYAALVDKMTTTSPLRKKLKQKGYVHDEYLDGEEGKVHCNFDHAGMIDFCIKLEHLHDLEVELKGTACMDCNQKYDEVNTIPSTKRPISLCDGYMKYKPVRCRKIIFYECTTSRMLKQQEVSTRSIKKQKDAGEK